MIKTTDLKAKLATAEYDDIFAGIYKKEDIASQKERYIRIAESFEQLFGTDREVGIFSAPGRTEVGGNHTDHNHGKVLAASVNLDAVAVVSMNNDNIIRFKSEGYKMDAIDLSDMSVMPNERGRSESLVRGVAAGFRNRGYNIITYPVTINDNVIAVTFYNFTFDKTIHNYFPLR